MIERESQTNAPGTVEPSASVPGESGPGPGPDSVEEPSGANGGAAPTPDQVFEALKVVVDPELGINVVDLGLVYDVQVEDEVVKVTYTLTSMGCPVGPLIEQQVQQVLTTIPGVAHVEATQTFDPPWSVDRMSEEARLAMGMF